MKNFRPAFFIFLLAILFAVFPFFAQAVENWTKSSNNPVLSLGPNSWDNQTVFQPSVLYLNNQYYMWYSGYNGSRFQIGYATSTDGINWTKNQSNPVLSKLSAGRDAHSPMIINDNGTFKMWYVTSLGGGTTDFKIHYATSLDGISWTDDSNSPVISPTESWEINGTADPYVIKLNNTYHMWYTGFSGGTWKTGYATSSDGISWVKYSNNPVSGDGVGSVLYQNSIFTMFYHSSSQINKATSANGINWTASNENPLLQRGANGEFDDFLIAGPKVIQVGDTLKMYYAAHDGSTGWKIGLAELAAPNPTPTPSPSPSPTPTPFPYFSQGESPWGDDEYDNAINKPWAKPPHTKMADLGCFVTSAAMVLKARGVTMTPGNSEKGLPPKQLDPGTLNEWLINIKDGSFRNGITNLASIANMTKKVRSTVDPTSPQFEFRFSGDTSEGKIDSVLNDHKYLIPQVFYPPSPSDMHFLVITNKENGTYAIKDPISANRILFSDYYEHIDRLNWFEETHSDFSYLILAVDESVGLKLIDSNGNEVGDVLVQHPIADVVNNQSSGAPTLKMLWFAKPPDGTYTLTVTAPTNQSYQLDTYIYDVQGEGGLKTATGVVGAQDTDTYIIQINSSSSNNSSVNYQATFSSLQSDVTTAFALGWITNRGVYKSFIASLQSAKKAKDKGSVIAAKMVLQGILTQLGAYRGTLVTQQGYDLLKPAIEKLIATL